MSKYIERIKGLNAEITMLQTRRDRDLTNLYRLEGAVAIMNEFAKEEQEQKDAEEKARQALLQMQAQMDVELNEKREDGYEQVS